MMRLITAIMAASVVSTTCYAQDFLKNYSQLDESNIENFMNDWKYYSDSCANNIIINDTTVFNLVNSIIDTTFYYRVHPTSKVRARYIVVYKDITLNKYHFKHYSDTSKTGYLTDKYAETTFTHKLPQDGLYLTSEIKQWLRRFIGPDNEFNHHEPHIIKKVDKNRVAILQEYIPVSSHWDVWIFNTAPTIFHIDASKERIDVETGYSFSGETIGYYMDGDKVIGEEVVSEWIS